MRALDFESKNPALQLWKPKVDAVLLFNILHCERPVELMRHAAHALRQNGQVFVIHWRHGETPQEPSLHIRPRPEQIIEWAGETRLRPMGKAKESAIGPAEFRSATDLTPKVMPVMRVRVG
jgi:hypothetical protein